MKYSDIEKKARNWQQKKYPEFSDLLASKKCNEFCFTFSVPDECTNPVSIIIDAQSGEMREIDCPSEEWLGFPD